MNAPFIDPFTYKTVSDSRRIYLTAWRELMSSQNPEMAWFGGMLWGDGHIGRDYNGKSYAYTVSCVGTQEDMGKWAALVCSDLQPKICQNERQSVEYVIHDRDFVQWLSDTHGDHMVGKKSAHIRLPKNLSDELMPHFLRGYWDADGYVRVLNKKGKLSTGSTTIGGVSRGMIEDVSAFLTRQLSLDPVALQIYEYDDPNKNKSFYIAWTGIPALKVLDYIYGSAPQHIRSDRKYKDYLTIRDNLQKRAFVECSNCGMCSHAAHQLFPGYLEFMKEDPDRELEGETGELIRLYGSALCPLCWGFYNKSQVLPNHCLCGRLRPPLVRGVCKICHSRERTRKRKLGKEYKGPLEGESKYNRYK